MRIGEITQDNYAQYMRLFGAKDTKALDHLWNKKNGDSSGVTSERIAENRYSASLKAGDADDGMLATGRGDSWKKIVPVSDEIRQAMINARREGILENANYTLSAKSGDKEGALIQKYVKTLPPSERLSASWTLQKIAQEEGARIGDYLKSKIPNLQPGQSFDRKILTGSNYGLNDPVAKRVEVAV